jgi:hypothetical protein
VHKSGGVTEAPKSPARLMSGKFFDIHAANGAPLAHQALERIGALHGVEKGRCTGW